MDSESGSTSSEWKAERKGGSVRMLAKRPNGQLRERVTQLMEGKSDGKSWRPFVEIYCPVGSKRDWFGTL